MMKRPSLEEVFRIMKKHPNLSSSWRNPIMSMMIMMSLILCLGHQDFLVLLFCLLFHCVSEETLCDSCWTSCLTRSLFHCKEESRVRSPDKNRDQIACYHHLSASFYCDERVISFSVHLYLISWIENDLRWMLFISSWWSFSCLRRGLLHWSQRLKRDLKQFPRHPESLPHHLIFYFFSILSVWFHHEKCNHNTVEEHRL